MDSIQSIKEQGLYKGYEYVVKVNQGKNLIGCVKIPESHELYGLSPFDEEELYKKYQLNYPLVLGGKFKYDENYYISYCSFANISDSIDYFNDEDLIGKTVDGCKKIIDLIKKE